MEIQDLNFDVIQQDRGVFLDLLELVPDRLRHDTPHRSELGSSRNKQNVSSADGRARARVAHLMVCDRSRIEIIVEIYFQESFAQ